MSAIALWKNLDGRSTNTSCRFPGNAPWVTIYNKPFMCVCSGRHAADLQKDSPRTLWFHVDGDRYV